MNKVLLLVIGLSISFAGYTQTEKFNLDSFSEISLGISGDLYITQGSTQSVEIKGDRDDIEELIVEVRGSRLVVKREGSWSSWKNSGKITIYVTIPEVEGISVSGSGSVIGKSKIKSDDLEISVSGSGDIELDLDLSGELDLSISGSGECYLKGKAYSVDLHISGSGEVEAEDLVVERVDARISGSGSAEITVNESIEARISGSGTILYAGNPSKVNSHSSGSGKVRKM